MNNILQLVLLLVGIYAKEKLLPNLLFMRGRKRVAAVAGQKQQQGTHPESHGGKNRINKGHDPFGLKREGLEQQHDMNEINQKLDRLSKQLIDKMNAQHEEMSDRLNIIATDLKHHGVYIQGKDGEEQQQRLSSSTTPVIIAKIDECFQELMGKMENYNKQPITAADNESSTKDYVSAEMERVAMELQASLETKINQLVHNVKALSLGFAAAVTIALGAVALPKMTDWIQSFLSSSLDELDE
jgi:hypothetical protein